MEQGPVLDVVASLEHSDAPALLLVDAAQRVDWANAACAELTGWDRSEIRGRPIGQLLAFDGESTAAPGPEAGAVSGRVLSCFRGQRGARNWLWRICYRLGDTGQELWQVFAVTTEEQKRFSAPSLDEVFSSGVAVSLVLDNNSEVHYAAGSVPWGLRDSQQLPSTAAYLGPRDQFALGATIDAVLEWGEPRSLRLTTRAPDTLAPQTWNCRVSPLRSDYAERVCLVAIEDSWGCAARRTPGAGVTVPVVASSLPYFKTEVGKAWATVERDIKRIGATLEVSHATKHASQLIDLSVWRRTVSVLRHLARTSTSLHIRMRWLAPQSAEAKELKRTGPTLSLELLANAPPPESTATGLRAIQSGERSWLGSLSRAVSGRMRMDATSGVIAVYIPGLPRPGEVTRPTALLACASSTNQRHAKDLLHMAGFNVLAVECPDKAAAVAAECPQSLALVVCDASFPVMSGVELHDEVLRRHPSAKAVFLCGSPDGFAPNADRDWSILTAPLDPRALDALLGVWGLAEPAFVPRLRTTGT